MAHYIQVLVFIAVLTTVAVSDTNFVVQTTGTAGSITATQIIITPSAASSGAVIYLNESQHALYGFETTFAYQSTLCGGSPSGGDGYINTTETIGLGGGLGVGRKSDIAFVAIDPYSSSKKIIIAQYKNGDTANGNVRGLPGTAVPALTVCAPAATFKVVYSPPDWTVYMDGTSVATKTMNLSDNFDSDQPLYTGFTGSTGAGYMQQAITLWNYTAVLPPVPPVEPVAAPVSAPALPPLVPATEVIPVFECYEQLTNGSYQAWLGYNNTASGVVQLLQGDSNQFVPAITGTVPLTLFWPGRSPVYPSAVASLVWDGSAVNWILTDYVVTINATLSSLCPANISVVISFTVTSKNDTLAQLDDILTAVAHLLQISRSRVVLIGITFTSGAKRAVHDDDLQAQLELEISGTTPATQTEPSAAAAVQSLVTTAANQTALNEVVNGGTAGPNQFVLVEVKSSEQSVAGTRITSPSSAVPTRSDDTPRSVPVSGPVSRVSASAVTCVHGVLLALAAMCVV